LPESIAGSLHIDEIYKDKERSKQKQSGMEGTTKRIKWLLFVKSSGLYHEINNEAGSQKA